MRKLNYKEISSFCQELAWLVHSGVRVGDGLQLLAEEEKADRMISAMYEYFKVNLDKLPEFYYGMLDNNDIDTVICDYISGMSDGYAVKTFNDIFVPKSWKL